MMNHGYGGMGGWAGGGMWLWTVIAVLVVFLRHRDSQDAH